MHPWTTLFRSSLTAPQTSEEKMVKLVKRVIKRSMVLSNQSEKKKKKNLALTISKQGLFSIFTTVQKKKKEVVNNSRHDHPLSGISCNSILLVFFLSSPHCGTKGEQFFKTKYYINCPTVSQTSSPHTTRNTNPLSPPIMHPVYYPIFSWIQSVTWAFPKRNRTWRLRYGTNGNPSMCRMHLSRPT